MPWLNAQKGEETLTYMLSIPRILVFHFNTLK